MGKKKLLPFAKGKQIFGNKYLAETIYTFIYFHRNEQIELESNTFVLQRVRPKLKKKCSEILTFKLLSLIIVFKVPPSRKPLNYYRFIHQETKSNAIKKKEKGINNKDFPFIWLLLYYSIPFLNLNIRLRFQTT